MAQNEPPKPSYETIWDDYVTQTYPGIQSRKNAAAKDDIILWPGDEWGQSDEVDRLFDLSFPKLDPNAVHQFVEIGSGAGRYTLKALQSFPKARLQAFDVSASFLQSLQTRLDTAKLSDRVTLTKLGTDPDALHRHIAQAGLTRKIDVLYSYDAMVHVDLQTLTTYFTSAGLILRTGGTLVMNVADATSDAGCDHLFRSARRVFAQGGQASTKFIWHSPDVFTKISERLGFALSFTYANNRDLYLTARLEDPDAATATAKSHGWPVL